MDALFTPAMISTLIAIGTSVAFFAIYAVLLTSRMKSFSGKVVVITGCSSGIGEELAYKYAREGSKLVLAARRKDKLDEIVQKCEEIGKETGATAFAIATDVTKQQDCENLIDETVKRHQNIDLLILNAGQGCLIKVADVKDIQPLKTAMDVNFWGCVYPTIRALPHLRKVGGSICVISSLAAILPTPRRTLYGASKAAVTSYFNALRSEEPTIHVTIVCPGFIKTDFHENAFSPDGIPLKRKSSSFMTAKECARLIVDAIGKGKREYLMTWT
eukprot:TRINITY_DN5804_c0_g1_i3.p1 TRINITY_DN5804_c0_g1~~TRINITY_DN5804_c0_g1_i3.p1  ORF type:complete len:273 (+),score=56.22 TRINITY_DN5804_c0_g1_i3:165-983(+)